MSRLSKIILTSGVILITIGIGIYSFGRNLWVPAYKKIVGKQTVAEVVAQHKSATTAALAPAFTQSGMEFPPESITLIAYKEEKTLELWTHDRGATAYIKSYDVLAASGEQGPKLREGDRQVPEGIYTIEYFNPNSSYHLSMKINYPNAFDQKHAKREGRTSPGGDIFIHGNSVSIGCLAIGDKAIEELFTLSALVGRENIKVIIAPCDPTKNKMIPFPHSPEWVYELYKNIQKEIDAITGRKKTK